MGNNRAKGAPLIGAALVISSLITIGSADVAHAADIPDEGLPAVSIESSPLVSERTEVLQAGVTGINLANDSFPATNVRVLAFAEIGNTIYVGGKFKEVQDATTLQKTGQPFLAAFDRTTGAWIDTFRPTLNGNVWDLKATDDGQLIVAGQFSNVNGAANTSGVAMLDATTGAVHPTWRSNLVLTGSTARPIARALDIEGDNLYIVGNFTRITGTDGITKNAGRAARVKLSTGNVDGAFLPNTDGIVFDVEAEGDRVYIVGNFHYVNGTWAIGMAPLYASNGQIVPNLQPWVRTSLNNTEHSYQQAILAVGDTVWQAGAQHSRQVYNRSDYSLLRSWVSHPWGDGQALAELNGYVYSGSHANGDTRLYQDAVTALGLDGATSSRPVRWMAAFNTATNEHVDWYPQIGTANGEGGWELFVDSTNCLWAGGDFNRGSYDGDTPRYVGGFAKFCTNDSVPPAPPESPVAVTAGGGVNLSWQPSAGDDRGGQVRYELLKNDSVFASYISITTFRDPNGTPEDRYFVRAMDYTGNRSATTPVFTAADNDTSAPSTPQNLEGNIEANGDVTLTWTASRDNIGVTEYIVFRNGIEIGRTPTATYTVDTPAAGNHWYQVRALDAAGNQSYKTPSTKITIDAGDVTAPSTPQNLAANLEANGDVTLTWTASNDDIGVTGYIVYRNGVVIDNVTSPTAVIATPASGDHWYQVRAVDAAGNQGRKTPPLKFTVTGADNTRPTTPQNLTGNQEPNGDVTLTWTASRDDIGVTGYIVYRNGIEIDSVTATTAVIPAPAVGTHWYQVRAFDAAGNQSFKTPPLAFEVQGATDNQNPTTPKNLQANIAANAVTLTWTASNDNIGVTGYRIYRNGIEIDSVTDTTVVISAPAVGAHWYQVRAFDAAGNQSYKTPPIRVDIL